MVTLVASHGGDPAPGWWDRVRPHSLGWVSARLDDGQLIGFVNVAWDGGVHAFLLDTKVSSAYQRHGIGIELVRRAGIQAKAAGCEWLHVDFEERLALLLRRMRIPSDHGGPDTPSIHLPAVPVSMPSH